MSSRTLDQEFNAFIGPAAEADLAQALAILRQVARDMQIFADTIAPAVCKAFDDLGVALQTMKLEATTAKRVQWPCDRPRDSYRQPMPQHDLRRFRAIHRSREGARRSRW